MSNEGKCLLECDTLLSVDTWRSTYRRFERTRCLRHQNRWKPWWWSQQILLKHRYISTRLNYVHCRVVRMTDVTKQFLRLAALTVRKDVKLTFSLFKPW